MKTYINKKNIWGAKKYIDAIRVSSVVSFANDNIQGKSLRIVR